MLESDRAHACCVVTHDLPFAAELCERAVILAGGRVVADGACRATCSPTTSCSPRHDLELPAGFDLARSGSGPVPAAMSTVA